MYLSGRNRSFPHALFASLRTIQDAASCREHLVIFLNMSCELLLATAVNSVLDCACTRWKVGKSKEVWLNFEHPGASGNSLDSVNMCNLPACLLKALSQVRQRL